MEGPISLALLPIHALAMAVEWLQELDYPYKMLNLFSSILLEFMVLDV